LKAHKLTVTQLSFSHSDKYLLSAGRDRQFSLFVKSEVEGEAPFKLFCKLPKAHERIIWGCDWTMDDKFFITGSRDKTCKIWSIVDDNVSEIASFTPAKVGVTSVAFAPSTYQSDSYLIAVGLENGLIQLWSFSPSQEAEKRTTNLFNIDPK